MKRKEITASTFDRGNGGNMESTQKDIVTLAPKTQKWKGALGTLFVWNPKGSQYKDFKTGETVTRDRQTLQVAQVGVPQKAELNMDTIEDLKELFASAEYQKVSGEIEKPSRLTPANPTDSS